MNRIAAITLFVAMMAGCAKAQSNAVELNIPFNFTVNHTLLPAGIYTFGFDSKFPDVLVIRDGMQTVKAKDLGERGSIGPEKPRTAIFRGSSGHYFLSEVLFDSASNGIYLPATKAERQTRRVDRNEDLASIAIH
jgi:hypothetical protein